MLLDPSGNLYGTTYGGGITCGTYPYAYSSGVVYKLDPFGRETVLYTFACGDHGLQPLGRVALDPEGNLYGTTTNGGTGGGGVVYKLDPSGHETVLYSFSVLAGGWYPLGLMRGTTGNLFGTTFGGGTRGTGVIFEIIP